MRSGLVGSKGSVGRLAVRQHVEVDARLVDGSGVLAEHDRGRATDLDAGGRLDLEVVPATGRHGDPAPDHLRRLVDVAAVDGEDLVRRVGPHPHRAVVGVHHPDPGQLAGGRVDGDVALLAVEGPGAAVGVGDGEDVGAVVGLGGLHDQPSEEPPDHLLVRHLVGVVPVAAGVVDDEPVDVVLADADGVLGDAGDAVLGVRDVDPVPVHADAVLDVLVVHADLEQVTLGRLDRRTGGGAVEGVALDLAARRQRDRALVGRQLHDHVGRRGRCPRRGRRR